jgi:hypothetical protein
MDTKHIPENLMLELKIPSFSYQKKIIPSFVTKN